jgi:hypothetical protein
MLERLKKLPASSSEDETPVEFWMRVEKAGLLIEALKLYDEIAIEYEDWRHTRRETKKEFDQRIEREGRRVEAERLRRELLESGLTKRKVQAKLVESLQPVDGSVTKAWETPNPWECGRLFKKKADQDRVMESAKYLEEDIEDEEQAEDVDRLQWAKRRRDERQALAGARRRAQGMKLEQERLRSEQVAKATVAANGRVQSPAGTSRNGGRTVGR